MSTEINQILRDNIRKISNDHPEYEDFVPRTKIDEGKIEQAKSTLNEEQLILFDKLLEFLNDKDHMYFVLEGYAGTGKTYALARFVSILATKVALSAPTNKAVKVLADNGELNGLNVSYATIHKLLALKVTWQPPKKKGERPKQILTRNFRSEPTVNDYSLLIIDEVSMLNRQLFEMLENEKDNDLKIIFMGDPAQIPPINEVDSIPLLPAKRQKYQMLHYTLTKNMRQTDHSNILKVAYAVRDKRFESGDAMAALRRTQDDTFFYSLRDKAEFNETMLSFFISEQFGNDANYAKTIAWTNEMVNYYNSLIREKLFGKANLPRIVKGEKLIADTAIIKDGLILFNTSDELEVMDFEMKTMNVSLPGKPRQTELDFGESAASGLVLSYYKTYVKYMTSAKLMSDFRDDEEEERNVQAGRYIYIDILHESSEQLYQSVMKSLAKIGKETKRWQPYYDMHERFARVKYNYAITAHKAQGSTYQNVFIIEDDIDRNDKYVERNRIKYTAITRPKDKLFILSSRNR